MTVLRTTMAVAVVAILAFTFSARISASEELTRAKGLYQSAAYDDALTLLNGISDPAEAVEVHQYRVLCLIALDRREEAQQAMATLVGVSPAQFNSAVEMILAESVRSAGTAPLLQPSSSEVAAGNRVATIAAALPGGVSVVGTLIQNVPSAPTNPGKGPLADDLAQDALANDVLQDPVAKPLSPR